MDIDLNCDMGEGAGTDAEVMPFITSANIACGGHAGDEPTARETIRLAAIHRVRIGAHPGFRDREHFGRRELDQPESATRDDCLNQVRLLDTLARQAGLRLSHLKAHGALYNMACRDDRYGRPVVDAAAAFDLPVLGLPGSRLADLASGRVPFVAEGFADRRYRADGSLVPRTEPNAFIDGADEAARQALWLARERGVRTLCVHGDNPQAVAFVRTLRAALTDAGFTIRSFA